MLPHPAWTHRRNCELVWGPVCACVWVSVLGSLRCECVFLCRNKRFVATKRILVAAPTSDVLRHHCPVGCHGDNCVVAVPWQVCLSFNPSSSLIATGSMDTTCKLWDVEKGVETVSLGVCCPFFLFIFSFGYFVYCLAFVVFSSFCCCCVCLLCVLHCL